MLRSPAAWVRLLFIQPACRVQPLGVLLLLKAAAATPAKQIDKTSPAGTCCPSFPSEAPSCLHRLQA